MTFYPRRAISAIESFEPRWIIEPIRTGFASDLADIWLRNQFLSTWMQESILIALIVAADSYPCAFQRVFN